MKNIRILQVNKFYHPITGGVEKVVQQIAEGLKDRCEMMVLTCQKKGCGSVDRVNGVEVHRAGSFGTAFSTPISLSFFNSFRRMRKNCDILHIHMPFPLADVAMWLFGFSGKVVLWWHADIVKQKKLLVLYRPFMMHLLKRAARIMVATEGHILGSDYLSNFREKCAIIPFGVDMKFLEKADGSLVHARVQNGPIRFLTVGRLVYYKGYDVLIKALAKVENAQLTIVGGGPLEGELKTLAKSIGVQDRVLFAGEIDNNALANAFANCDVFVLSSIAKSEAFALVQIEAMAYGNPVINTNLKSGVPYVSLDGITGLTVPPCDVEALADAMNKLAADADLRERFGKAAYRRAREEYALDTMLDRVMAEYEKLMK